ncbi:DUF1345 domain-containing protein [Derxia lacustris]|uniref:DUF1345 domain-containing protein n=1 Tax=Derxia lacustris TaxID=764842 RepID=UPI000A1754DB|nr:DUF1345 domain-containing protein [Derxia lacustris]
MRLLAAFIRTRRRLLAGMLAGVVASALAPPHWDAVARLLLGWNAGVAVYLLLIWHFMAVADDEGIRLIARSQDATALSVLVMLTVAAVTSLAAIVFELARAAAAPEGKAMPLLLTVGTLVGSWLLLPTIFALHYAHMFHLAPPERRPLAFPEDGTELDVEPDYWDFLYFAFTIAVAAQTADITTRTRSMRRVVLAQSLLAFFFNAAILAAAINIAAGMVGR